jgi:hypothetical protein
MTEETRNIWLVSILIESGLVLGLWRRMRQAYPVLVLYLIADLMAGLLLAFLAVKLPFDPYTGAWCLFQLLMAVCQVLVCAEAVRAMGNLRPYLPAALYSALLLSGIGSLTIERYLRQPQHYNSWLEPTCLIKSVIDLGLALFLIAVLAMPDRLKEYAGSLEFRHTAILCGYFFANSLGFFWIGRAYAHGVPPPENFLMLLSAGTFLLWSFVFAQRHSSQR